MNEFYIILAGVLLRIAIPALVLISLAVLLSRLDARWKKESMLRIKKEQAVASQPVAMVTEQKNCTPEERARLAAKKSEEPCWQLMLQDNGDFDPRCVTCDIFLMEAGPVPEIVTVH